MARIRSVKPEFFRHEGLYEAEHTSGLPLRLSFIGLWTAADHEGRFKWRPRQLKLDCLPYDDIDFEQILNVLAEHGFIVKYEINGELYGHIPTWHQHQHINHREMRSILPAPTEESMVHARACPGTPGHARGEREREREREGEGEKERKNNFPADAGLTTADLGEASKGWASKQEYAFEAGVIRLNQKNLDAWKKAYSYLDVPAELTGLATWAGSQARWFPAVSGALAKRNREQKLKSDQARSEVGRLGFGGIT